LYFVFKTNGFSEYLVQNTHQMDKFRVSPGGMPPLGGDNDGGLL